MNVPFPIHSRRGWYAVQQDNDNQGYTWEQKLVRWAIGSAACFGIQWLLILALAQFIPHWWAFLIAYLVTGHINFVYEGAFVWGPRLPFSEQLKPNWPRLRANWPKHMLTNPAAAMLNATLQSHAVWLESPLVIMLVANALTAVLNILAKRYVVHNDLGILRSFKAWLARRRPTME